MRVDKKELHNRADRVSKPGKGILTVADILRTCPRCGNKTWNKDIGVCDYCDEMAQYGYVGKR